MEKVLYWGYFLAGTAGYAILRLLLPILKRFKGKYCYGLGRRLGEHDSHVIAGHQGGPVVWLHACSVGEVQAAEVVLEALVKELPDATFVLSTTTMQGHKVALSKCGKQVACLMAPLDMPAPVRKTLDLISPDVYICLETELWPVMLTELQQRKVTSILLNARVSERSFQRYLYIRKLMQGLLGVFTCIATISEDDARRFVGLGVDPSRLAVCGNIKVGAMSKTDTDSRRKFRRLLGAGERKVFICGSTHTGEELQLVDVYKILAANLDVLWIIAPRHLERLGEVKSMLRDAGLDHALYSQVKRGEVGQQVSVIVVDTMGDLADLYSAGDYVFCGGSLTDKGGHNVLEVIRWGYPVYYGPYMSDFRETTEKIEEAGCGFKVDDAKELANRLLVNERDPVRYAKACEQARITAANWRRPAEKQVAALMDAIRTAKLS